MKRIIFLMLILMVSLSLVVSAQEKEGYEDDISKTIEEDIYEDIGEVKLRGEAGLTPDSSFYFLESLVETVLVGEDPETALKYKEEKVLEFKEMIESGNNEAAEKALEGVKKYNEILKKEVTPDLDKQVRESSKATKELYKSYESKLEGEEWENVKEGLSENIKTEDKIALAAKISNKIKQLCEALSDLDPLEYSKMCKTDDDAPKWKKDLDRKLTEEQEKEAKEFFEIMSECFQNPEECKCDDISIKPFAEKCNVIAPLAAKCEEGSEEACQMMEDAGDPIDLLPDYLQDVMENLEDDYGDAKHDLHNPIECVEAGATSREDCMKVMFKVHAPPECLEALESGKIDPKNEREARKSCEDIMFNSEAPEECIEAGLKDFRECERYMFKIDAPQECIDAGLTGSGRDDRKKCDAIRFKLDAPQECLDAGITGEVKDDWKKCELIKFKLDSPQECIDAGLTGKGRDDWKKCDAIKFRLDAPKECLDAGLDGSNRNDWKKCDAIKFKLDAHPDCLAAGLTGERSGDWRKCKKIQFKAEAPEECLAAGLDGSGRRDWEECKKIRKDTEGESRSDCGPDELHICDENGYNCKCTSDSNTGCGAVDCQEGYVCQYGQCFPKEGGCGDCSSKCPGASRTDCVNDQCECYYEDQGSGGSGCKDGCSDECPGASSTSCDKGYCECFYEDEESECADGCHQECGDQNTNCVDDKCVCLGYGEGGPPPSDGGTDSGSSGGTDGSTDGGSTGGTDGSTDGGSTGGTDGGSDSGSDSNSGSSDSGGDNSDSGGDAITGGTVKSITPSLSFSDFIKKFLGDN